MFPNMTAHRIDPDVPRAPVVGAAVSADVYRRVIDLAAEKGYRKTSAAVRELLALGIDGERGPPGSGG